MKLTNLRVIGISFLLGLALGGGGGAVYALMADKILWHGVGTGLFFVGIIALGLGLTGAVEPAEGWSSKRAAGRRSFAARMVEDEDVEISSGALAVWSFLVGGTLVALSMAAFWAAAR